MMKNILIVMLVILSVFMVGSACSEPVVTEHEGSIDYYSDTSEYDPNDYMYIEADAQWQYTEYKYCSCYSEFEGEADAHGEIGYVVTEDGTTTTDSLGGNIHVEFEGHDCCCCDTEIYGSFDGNWYTGHQVDQGRSHSYFEEGYMFDGEFYYSSYYGLDFDFYSYEYYNFSKYWTDELEDVIPTNSAPALGFGFDNPDGSVPALYTYMFDGESVTVIVFPVNAEGPVICTPPRFQVGKPLTFDGTVAGMIGGQHDNTARGLRIALWHANHAE